MGAGTATNEYFAPGPSYDTWANYKLTLDLTAKTMSVALNGVPVSSMQGLAISGYSTSSTLTMPGTAVLLMLGGTLVIVRRRCRK